MFSMRIEENSRGGVNLIFRNRIVIVAGKGMTIRKRVINIVPESK